MSMRTNLAFVGALAALPPPALAASVEIPHVGVTVPASATFLPKVNIDASCRKEVAAADLGRRSAAYRGCVRDERSALAQLRRRWADYSVQARTICVFPRSGTPLSYVAVLTCLQMQPGGRFAVKSERPGGLYSWTLSSRRLRSP